MAPSLSLPPIAVLESAAATLVERAAGDTSAERAINKALWNLQNGLEIRPTSGGFLMPSCTRAGVIHRVSNLNGCTCEAARSGKACWHASALAIIEEAQIHYTMPALTPALDPYCGGLIDKVGTPIGGTSYGEVTPPPPPSRHMAERIARAREAAQALNECF